MGRTRHCPLITIDYISDLPKYKIEKPYRLIGGKTVQDLPETNIVFAPHDGIRVEDIRGTESLYNLERNKFQLCQWPWHIDLAKASESSQVYSVEMALAVQKEVGAEKVIAYDCRVSNKLCLCTCHNRGSL